MTTNLARAIKVPHRKGILTMNRTAGLYLKLRAQLAKVEAEIERRDPKPPTDDPAAFGGVGCTTTARWQKRVMSDSNISRMATLWDEQRRLAEAVRIAESWANS